MSTNSDKSRPAAIVRLLRQAKVAEAAGRFSEAAAVLQEVARLDPRDTRTLHRLGELHRTRLGRPGRAASWYARAARVVELDGASTKAIASWRLVIRCDTGRLEPYERIGLLYAALGRCADARLHYESSARVLSSRGQKEDAAILRAQLAAMEPVELAAMEPVENVPVQGSSTPERPPLPVVPDTDALALAAEREQDARVYFHHGLHAEARRRLEDVLALLPDHVGARQLLVEVCRALGDADAAAMHLRVLTEELRRESTAGAGEVATVEDEPWELPPFEEWSGETAPEPCDVASELMAAVRDELEQFVSGLERPPAGRPSLAGRPRLLSGQPRSGDAPEDPER